jgi:2-dehydro-3-deoxygluconokinase
MSTKAATTTKPVVTFGEIMGRFMPPGHLRLRQVMPGSLDLTFGGAEANVAVSLARLCLPARYVTALPEGPLTGACLDDLRGHGVDVSGVRVTKEGRFGLYFVERGANQRPSTVTYDREGSAISIASASTYDWDRVLEDARWLHTTGITPAISERAAEATIEAVRTASARSIPVSFDLNFRKKLWRWEAGTDPRALAGRVVREVLPHVTVLIGNEEDAEDVLGIRAGESRVDAGELDVDRYPEVARQIAREFPNLRKIAITLRESVSADFNRWGAMLYDVGSGTATFAPTTDGVYSPYEIHNIVDRVGGGDSFGAGLIRILAAGDSDAGDETALRFAVAASCLAHSIEGDFNLSSYDEVVALATGSGSGRVIR